MEKKKITNGEFLKAVTKFTEVRQQHQRSLRLVGARRLLDLVRDKLYEFFKKSDTESDLNAITEAMTAVSKTIIEAYAKPQNAMPVLLNPFLAAVLNREEWDYSTHEPRPMTRALKAVLGDIGVACNDYAPRYMAWNVFEDDVLKRVVNELRDGWLWVGPDVASAVNKLAADRGWETRLHSGVEGVEDISDPQDPNRPGLWIVQEYYNDIWYMSCTGRTIARFEGKWSLTNYGVTIWHHQFAGWDDDGQLTVGTPAGVQIRLKDFTEAKKFNWVTLTM